MESLVLSLFESFFSELRYIEFEIEETKLNLQPWENHKFSFCYICLLHSLKYYFLQIFYSFEYLFVSISHRDHASENPLANLNDLLKKIQWFQI